MKSRLILWTLFFVAVINEIHNKGGGIKQDFSLINISFLLLSLISVWSVCAILESCKSKKLMVISSFLYAICFFYFYRSTFPMTYSLVINNSDYIFQLSGLVLIAQIAYSTFFASDVFWSMVFSGLIWMSYLGAQLAELDHDKRKKQILVSAFCLTSISFMSPVSYDPGSCFLRSVYQHYFQVKNSLQQIADNLPLLPQKKSETHFRFSEKPNIFLVMIESFNSRFVNQKDENGVEYLPYFNQLTKKHLYFANYYSNSIQTAKGHFAALCNQIPLVLGMEFKNSDCFTKKCAPSILAAHDYQTYFFQADPNFNTDNSQAFMKSHGFQKTPELVKDCNQEASRCYSLGIRDHLFYRRTFDYLKNEQDNQNQKPFFAALATVSTHMPFNYQSETERALYKNPKNFKENYLNTIRMADDSLKELIQLFEESPWAHNSVLMITGDHAFPTGEHGSTHNDSYAYQENFGVPLLIYDSRQDLKKKYSQLESNAYSHLNLGLTILDFAQLETSTNMIAPSIFSEQSLGQTIYLVQPYSGGYQATIHWPFKHIFAEFREEETIFNLQNDPNEQKPILPNENPNLFAEMRIKTAQIYRQQDLYSCQSPELKTKPILGNLSEKIW